MGDGRYYSLYQFFSVSFLTLFLIFVSINAVGCVFQGFQKQGRLVFFAHLTLGLGAASRFCEAVWVVSHQAQAFKALELALVLVTLGLVSQLFTPDRPLFSRLHALAAALSGLLILGSLFSPSWLLFHYDFSGPTLGTGFLGALGIWGLHILLIAKGRGRYPSTLPLLLFIGICLGSVGFSHRMADTSLLLFYPLAWFSLKQAAARLETYRIGDQAFSDINNLIRDAVIVSDANQRIIFKNQHAREAEYLRRDMDQVPEDDVTPLFNGEIRPVEKYQIPTLAWEDREQFLECHHHDIRQGDQVTARSLIISDVSDLIGMLDRQAEEKARLDAVNDRHLQYSRMVFDLEKEKEITTLLSRVTQKQEDFMDGFHRRVARLLPGLGSSRFPRDLDALIQDTHTNLSEVRDLVARYRRFYGTGN